MGPIWERPPRPAVGDVNDQMTYAGVGKVITQWELIEGELCHIYCGFVRCPFDRAAIEAYGMDNIFKTRATTVEKAAENYFTGSPNQEAEGAFKTLIDLARCYSQHRNDVAHSIVRSGHWILRDWIPTEPDAAAEVKNTQWWLVPAFYISRRMRIGGPDFLYTSVELESLANALGELARELALFRHDRLPPTFTIRDGD
jgi:hypothetical protein